VIEIPAADPCPCCARRESILNAYADQIVAMEMELETLRNAHKVSDEIARTAIGQLHTKTTECDRVRDQLARLVHHIRRRRSRR
jgi:hypothetical protein